MKCAAVIPCYNERATITALVQVLRRYIPFVLVVDDGSTDDTGLRAAAGGAVVLRHERNRGKGVALRTGLSHLLERGFDWAATLDGDGQHAPADLPALFRCAKQTGARLVIGNRMGNARVMPWLRRLVNRWMSRKLSERAGRLAPRLLSQADAAGPWKVILPRLAGTLVPPGVECSNFRRISLPDTQCGFRLVHLRTWWCLPWAAERFEVESEMLMGFVAAKQPVAFVPVRVIASARRSRIHPLADTLRWWRWWAAGTAANMSRRTPAATGRIGSAVIDRRYSGAQGTARPTEPNLVSSPWILTRGQYMPWEVDDQLFTRPLVSKTIVTV